MKILVCEDEEILMSAIGFRLQKQGFELIPARNGEIALEMLENRFPDVLVVNVRTSKSPQPDMINYVRKVMKQMLPVILVGEFEDEKLLLEGIRAGADDFILKPFKPSELLIRIKRVLQDKKVAPIPGIS